MMRISIERPGGIGDSLLMVPALRALKAQYPDSTILYRGQPAGAAWLQAVGLVNQGLGLEHPLPPGGDALIGFAHEPQRWRREHFHDARFVTSCPWLAQPGTHQALHQYQQIKRALPIWAPFDSSPLTFRISPEIAAKYADAIVLAPGTSTPTKIWPHFAWLADALRRLGQRVVFLEASPESAGFETFRGGFLPAASVIAAAKLVIGNDSSAVHVAGLVSTPSIALFGPSLPAHWQPIGIGSTVMHGCPTLYGRRHTSQVIACNKGDCWDRFTPKDVVDCAMTLVNPTQDPLSFPNATLTMRTQWDVAVAGVFDPVDGFGGMSIRLADGLEDTGVRVHRIRREQYAPSPYRVTVVIDQPPFLQQVMGSNIVVPYTMYESTKLPAGYAEPLNRARHVIVPTQFCKDLFEREGVATPITVIPGGIDPRYCYIDRPAKKGVTTLMVGTLIPRKNWEIGVDAWRKAAGPHDRLIVKAGHHYLDYSFGDPRITLESGPAYHTETLIRAFARADILLALGSEGYGLPLLEGMATGLACIALDAMGQTDAVRESNATYPVPIYSWRDHQCMSFGQVGQVPYPSVDVVAAGIAALSADAIERTRLGAAASEWVLHCRTNRAMAARVAGLLEELVQGLPHAAGRIIVPPPRSIAVHAPRVRQRPGKG